MRAIVQDSYGAPEEVLALREVERPDPGEGEVLVRVRAAPIAGDDWHLMRGIPWVARMETGLLRPKRAVPGSDLAGVVEGLGAGVGGLRVGDAVFGWGEGALAEYAVVPETSLAQKPPSLSFDEAASVPTSAVTALQAVRDKGGVQPGQRVLIVGASGGVGTFAVQIAKALGARVTGVCGTDSVELVRSLGADDVIDYTRRDFTADLARYDVIVYLAGNRGLREVRRALMPRGTVVLVGGAGGRLLGGVARWLRGMVLSPFVSQRMVPLVHARNSEDLAFLKGLLESGAVTPVVSARYDLTRVTDAIAHFGEGHGRGKVVITL